MEEPLKGSDRVMIQAVTEAIADLELMERELESSDKSHTTGSRLLRADYWGKRAATRKRLAEVEFLTGWGDWRMSLRQALLDYRKGLQQGVKVDHWILGQYVVLRAVLGDPPTVMNDLRERWWDEAYRAVQLGIEVADPFERMWALSSLADLLMVALAADGWQPTDRKSTSPRDVRATLEDMVASVSSEGHCPAIWPTFRQFWRWRYWWTNPKWQAGADVGYEYLRPLVDRRIRPKTPSVS
jgi:hypothetical protein